MKLVHRLQTVVGMSNSNKTQSRRGFLRAFAVLAGGAAATVVVSNHVSGHADAPQSRAQPGVAHPQRGAITSARPLPSLAQVSSPARRRNMRPTAIPSVRL